MKWYNKILSILCIFLMKFYPHSAIASSLSSENIKEEKPKESQKSKNDKTDITHHLKKILIYTNANCDEVKNELKSHNIEFQDIDLTWNRKQKIILERKAGKNDTSYIFINNKYIGNDKDLMQLMKHGKLLRILQDEE